MIQHLSRGSRKIAFLLFFTFYGEMVAVAAYQSNQRQKNAFRYLKQSNRYSGRNGSSLLRFDDPVSYKHVIPVHETAEIVDAAGRSEVMDINVGRITGPGQPEMSAFQSVGNSNMVDLFTGDFSYNIPLLDVGGYPVNIGYRAGVSMDDEASWVGLGWNINPGTISRNLRGLPDDFNGGDSIKKTTSIKTNKTVGLTVGWGAEIAGLPVKIQTGRSLGVFHNNYKGWGLETGSNSSISAGAKGVGTLTAGLSITNNSQNGISTTPSLALQLDKSDNDNKFSAGSYSLSLPYNTRSGLKGLQMGIGIKQSTDVSKNIEASFGGNIGGFVSFASPTYTPSISVPYTSSQYTFSAKTDHYAGALWKIHHPYLSLSGYVSKQRIDAADVTQMLPAYGYMNFQNSPSDGKALLDFNREKDMPYREKPASAHIAMPSYTYDLFSITGEGTGGMFRAYRGDIGFVYDHLMRTKDESGNFGIDLGFGDLVHAGVDVSANRSVTQSGPWTSDNGLKHAIGFRKNDSTYEAVYLRNPGEKAVNSKSFYNRLGGDDVLAVNLYQPNSSGPSVLASASFRRYNNKQYTGLLPAIKDSLMRTERDKRTQVITYLTAEEASTLGLSKYVEIYSVNNFPVTKCFTPSNSPMGTGTGLKIEYFNNFTLTYPTFSIPTFGAINIYNQSYNSGKLSTRWSGKLEAPVTGQYAFRLYHDDVCKITINDSVVYSTWNGPRAEWVLEDTSLHLNLVAGQRYDLKFEISNTGGGGGHWGARLEWRLPGTGSFEAVPINYLYPPGAEADVIMNGAVTMEKRVNAFRKKSHISEVSVLNGDGRRYVYGIPVYNLKQKEASFAVNASNANTSTGMVKFNDGVENSINNQAGKDNYFSSEEIPAYAHSYLLTGIVSPDYSDLTGDGITDDDIGDAIRFNYSRVTDVINPFKWKAPYNDSATYNEGLKTYNRDDKGSYVYGEKELWYLNSIESKNMLAVFEVEDRLDSRSINEAGTKSSTSVAKRLKEIRLYSKADYLKNPTQAVAIKTVHFEYGYEMCKGYSKPENDSGKLTLKKIWFSYNGNDKGQLNPYSFKYHSNPSYNSKSFDRWGNYKNPSHNPGSMSNADYPYALQGYTSADSINANNNAAAWALNEIKLPSGGLIKVDYECDDYAYVQNKRAMQMFRVVAFNSSNNFSTSTRNLYSLGGDNLYVFIRVPVAPSNKSDVFSKYLEGIKKMYFRVAVGMPTDDYGSGSEFVSCYADLDIKSATDHSYYDKVSNTNIIWVKVKGIYNDGGAGGPHSPIRKAATQFLKLNLPSKAYPGSEVGDNLDAGAAVKVLFTQVDNILNSFISFDDLSKIKGWAKTIDTINSFARLDAPTYKKRGGGYRVKKVTIYDNWNAMTGGPGAGQRDATYGQEYFYTTDKEINGKRIIISSGVASYEPSIGGEENPFRQPIEYVERVSPLAPVTLGYTEEPLGEALFPSPSVGYSKVRVRSIHTKNKKSANGYEETKFFTAYDFPTLVDRSVIDDLTKKRFKPALSNFLRINAKHYMTISQGFKVELNDMHGKMRSQATFPETNPEQPITYTENFYKVDTINADSRKLSNLVTVINPDGSIDTAALVGKDVELMIDMREQRSNVNGANFNANLSVFKMELVVPPLMFIPSFFGFPQSEDTRFRSIATTKVIQRFGIIDSVVHIDKGSKVSTKNMLYDSETGDVLLTRTQNEFNDPIYAFNYPTHWAYEGMGLAYKNIGLTFDHITIKNGKITSGLSKADSTYFTSGDEILVSSKPKTGDSTICIEQYSTFPVSKSRLWVVNKNIIAGGAQALYFIDKEGHPFSGNDISLRVIRSGRRNLGGAVGSIVTLRDPLVKTGSDYSLKFDSSKILNASAAEFKQLWKVADKNNKGVAINCVNDAECNGNVSTCVCDCIKPLFDYIIDSARWNIVQSDNVTIQSLVTAANNAGYNVSAIDCPIIQNNLSGLFYTTTPQYIINNTDPALSEMILTYSEIDSTFHMVFGGCNISINSMPGNYVRDFTTDFNARSCTEGNRIYYSRLPDTTKCWTFRARNLDTLESNTLYYYPDCENVAAWDSTLIAPGDSVFLSCIRGVPAQFGFEIATDSLCYATPRPDTLLPFAVLAVESCTGHSCDTVYSQFCFSAITDTLVNPYVFGLLGNFRPSKSYAYYGARAEIDPSAITDIRNDGFFADFTSFWKFSGRKIIPQYDNSRWIWNSEMTLFNKKGFELENKDPLGRYNSGVYGYSGTLPVAVAQNSQYREVAFEGFEDYEYGTNTCDTLCPVNKHFDLSAYKNNIDPAESHSGRYSLRIDAGDTLNLAAMVSDAPVSSPALTFATTSNGCASNYLTGISTDETALLPSFSPIRNKKIVVSAWVKEDRDCKCESYTSNKLLVNVNTDSTTSYQFAPSGSIIEGWQRYEGVIELPGNAVSVNFNFIATDTSTVYVDDIRIHPYSSNMKTFVYHPVNLRLMADLDENNYATFYEYDDDGTLIRVKKETVRGIKTIKETRTGLIKDN